MSLGEVTLHQICEGILRKTKYTANTAGVGLEVGGGILGVESPQYKAVAVTGKQPDSLHDLAGFSEGKLTPNLHATADELCPSYFSISSHGEILVYGVAEVHCTLHPW